MGFTPKNKLPNSQTPCESLWSDHPTVWVLAGAEEDLGGQLIQALVLVALGA